MQLAKAAMRLRDEQLRARVVYVDPTIETNAELDAITDRVIKELQELQRAGMAAKMPADPGEVEIELIKSLRELLEKMLSPRREHFLRFKVETILRSIAGLYMGSEVYRQSGDAKKRTRFAHADEALLAALQPHVKPIVDELASYRYDEPSVMQQAVAKLRQFEKKLAGDVLARSRPELEALLQVFREVLVVFLMKDLRENVGDIAWAVVREAQVARGHELSYKIQQGQFPRFRTVFEAKFMEQLLASLQQPLARKMKELPNHDFREHTVEFAADARIYAEICAVMCNMVYEYLHGEGFLDLPVQWQQQVYV